jgi:phosphatidylserine/phosphatidylglycerophosphate/cardiolipin synthase-like enzyme
MAFDEIDQGTDRLVLSPVERRQAIIEFMRSAERELSLSMFRCDDFGIIDEVAAAVQRGVRVRVLITQRARGWKEKLKELTALLRSLGAEIRPYENPVMKYHAKYVIADDAQAIVTSLNFTRKCFVETCDFIVFTHDANVISGLKQIFDNDFHTPSLRLPPITGRLIVGPDHSRERLTDILSMAQTSIRIMDHRVTDPSILNLLATKQQQGVTVQVLGSGPVGGLISHGRMALIDEKTAIIGSIHLSPPSLDMRREVAILIEESTVVTELYDYFKNLAMNETNMMNLTTQPAPISPEDEDEEEDE